MLRMLVNRRFFLAGFLASGGQVAPQSLTAAPLTQTTHTNPSVGCYDSMFASAIS